MLIFFLHSFCFSTNIFGVEVKMSHIAITTQNKCHYYISIGDTKSTQQLLNLLIDNRTATTKEDVVVTFDVSANHFVRIGHMTCNDVATPLSVDQQNQIMQVYLETLKNPQFAIRLVHVEMNDRPGNPLVTYDVMGESVAFNSCATMTAQILQSLAKDVIRVKWIYFGTHKPFV